MKLGNKAESLSIDLLISAGWLCEKSEKGCKLYDFQASLQDSMILFEVKFDKMSCSTGNLAFEFWNPKKNEASGLSVSQADIWVYCFGDPLQIYIVELPILKRYIEDNPPKRTIHVGGDKNASLYLYDRDIIVSDIFWRIDNLSSEDLNIGLQAIINTRNAQSVQNDIVNFNKE